MAGENFNKEINFGDWLDKIIIGGINAGASDIHFDSSGDKIEVRYRIDGVLQLVDTSPRAFLDTVIARLKVMAQVSGTEDRRPCEGHIVFKMKDSFPPATVDLRLSIFPTISGGAAVIRILNRKDLVFDDIEKLGLDKIAVAELKNIIKRSAGMVLVTGPAGSGKTTTLYTLLNYLKSQKFQNNIITLEDPVELFFPGMRQSQINPEIGYTFAEGLKSILRQDPNIVMVGEIRDDETADISIRAALMGTLFFSTMHTTTSVGAITRFLEFGLSRSLVASALSAVIAQRLARTICPSCKAEVQPEKDLLDVIGIVPDKEMKFYQGKGCEACGHSGYRGRVGIYEVLFINKEIQRMIIEGESFTKIEKEARKNGMRTLKEVAAQKAMEGIITLEEVVRVAPI